jgi:cytidylate kinase
MGNSLLVYLNKRINEDNSSKKNISNAGPVITISREVGCNGLKLARLIAVRLNQQKLTSDWRVLSKEVFYESAKELNMDPEKVRKTFKQSDKYTFEEIIKAFNDKNYKSERKIVKTVCDVVLSFAIDGFCIIVGRAGHIIARNIKNSLHIRLIAPLDYRINNIMENNKLNREDAIQFIHKIEKERQAFRDAMNIDNKQEILFDITVNRAMFSDEEIVDIIEYAVNKKKILQGYKPSFDFF